MPLRTWLLGSLPATAILLALIHSQSPHPAATVTAGAALPHRINPDAPPAPRFITGLENRPNGGLRRVFDFFLNAEGEEPHEVLVGRIQAYLHHHLSPPADAEALQILDDYLALQAALREQSEPAAVPDEHGHYDMAVLQQRKQARRSTQQSYLSPAVYDAFYQEEDDYDHYALQKLAILQDTAQTPEQQQAAVLALEQNLPDTLAHQINADQPYRELRYAMTQWRDAPGDEATLRQLREQTVGAAAADRLEDLDTARAQWQQRVESWLQERAAVLTEPQLATEDRLTLVASQRATQFDEREQPRVLALERIHDRQQ